MRKPADGTSRVIIKIKIKTMSANANQVSKGTIDAFDKENEELYFEPLAILRELAMRTQVLFPHNEKDLDFHNEGFTREFGVKLYKILNLEKK